MHRLGDPDQAERNEGRHPWIKRQRGEVEHVYTLPVLAAFSVAAAGLRRRIHGFDAEITVLNISKDRWHDSDNPAAWFVGRHNIMTGQVNEPEVLSASVDSGRLLWLQAIDGSAGARYAELSRTPRDQHRYEARLNQNYRACYGEYRAGCQPAERFIDIEALESMMRLVSQTRDLELPRTVGRLTDNKRSA